MDNTAMKINLKLMAILAIFVVFGSCTESEPVADAYGNFEAEEILISAEANGKILSFEIDEGEKLTNSQFVALVDTILPALQMEELKAQRAKILASISNIDAQKKIIEQQKENLQIDLERVENMFESGASTQKQIDDLTGHLKVLDRQLTAYDAQKVSVAKELKILDSKYLLLNEQLSKCRVLNPKKGIVLEKYAKQGEITAAGKPLYKMADLDQIILKAYVSGAQLHQVKIGETCKVSIDKGEKKYLDFEGTITWISSQAEFTPKIIQTKEERVNMVYAIKVVVKNDGTIKLGMPGEVYLN